MGRQQRRETLQRNKVSAALHNAQVTIAIRLFSLIFSSPSQYAALHKKGPRGHRVIQRILPVTVLMASARSSRKFPRASAGLSGEDSICRGCMPGVSRRSLVFSGCRDSEKGRACDLRLASSRPCSSRLIGAPSRRAWRAMTATPTTRASTLGIIWSLWCLRNCRARRACGRLRPRGTRAPIIIIIWARASWRARRWPTPMRAGPRTCSPRLSRLCPSTPSARSNARARR